MPAYARSHSFSRPGEIPPLRASLYEPDGHDEARCDYLKHLWHGQDDRLRQRDRQVEENIRMLLGQHWIVWSDLRQRYVNLSELLSDDERRWRHMPVLNRLFLWWVLHHARMTENPPVLSWQAGPDRIDAMLAEVMDPVFKHLWYDVEMLEVLDRLCAWLIPAGRMFLKSRIDPFKGDPIPAQGPAMLGLLGPDGQPIEGPDGPIQRYVDDAPYGPGEDGEWGPRAELFDDGDDYSVRPTGQPHVLYEGGLEVDVVTCLEARGEWGEHIPWHRKGWHLHRTLVTPLQAWEQLGVELEPDIRGEQAESVGIIHRLLHGSGLFGAADGNAQGHPGPGEEFCTIYEGWFRPGRMPGTERTEESPGGRLLIVTGGGKVIRDGVRIAPFRYTSPIRCFDAFNLPGRPQGSSGQEFLNGPIRTRNRLHAQIMGTATLMANPIRVLDKGQGIEEGQIKGIPGEEVLADRRGSSTPVIEYVAPAQLGSDVYNAADRLAAEFDQIGNVAGTEGTAPTKDASGELVKELRYNSDRPIAAMMKRMVIELGRLAEDWIALVPIIWDQEKIISIVGEDGVARVIQVWPDLFRQGNVNVKPEIESMLPEGRGERQQRAFMFYKSGIYGQPGDPNAVNHFLDEARFPHMSRIVRPGGVDRATAEQNMGRLLQGTPAEQIPIFPWYNHAVHLHVLERFLASPEYLKVDPQIQQECATYWLMLREAAAERALMESGEQADVQAAAAAQRLGAEADLGDAARARGFDQPPERGPTGQLTRTHDAVA